MKITITLTKDEDGALGSATVKTGRPDACGNTRSAGIDRQTSGGYLIQTNFNDFYEQRIGIDKALGLAVALVAGL